ncbi:hypothetical protein OH76DRAFT_1422746 [Lentinus brumalis]|uniref:Transmembrane protein n=1 Tax=Lentinus brumalis TaxID=2498619 RepID=A0A371CP32_9APHY|nr:hypothetical protein OH76DRAFT_1422746 [Polyporus brumalis]
MSPTSSMHALPMNTTEGFAPRHDSVRCHIPNTTIVAPNLPLTGTNPTSPGSPGTGGSGSSGEAGSGSNGRSHVGPIVGGVLGSVTLVAAASAGTFFWYHRRGRSQRSPSSYSLKQEEPMASKAARERYRAMRQGQPTAPSEVFAAAGEDQGSAADNSFRNAFLVGLRSEVEHLRTLMQGIREERLQPPPEYSG